MEGEVIVTQDLIVFSIEGEDANGKLIGKHRSTGIGRPRFWERARYYGVEKQLAAALDAGPKPSRTERGARDGSGQPSHRRPCGPFAGALFMCSSIPAHSGEAKAEKRVQAFSQSGQQRRSAIGERNGGPAIERRRQPEGARCE